MSEVVPSLDRRTVVKAAAWTGPVVVVASASPAFAASGLDVSDFTIVQTGASHGLFVPPADETPENLTQEWSQITGLQVERAAAAGAARSAGTAETVDLHVSFPSVWFDHGGDLSISLLPDDEDSTAPRLTVVTADQTAAGGDEFSGSAGTLVGPNLVIRTSLRPGESSAAHTLRFSARPDLGRSVGLVLAAAGGTSASSLPLASPGLPTDGSDPRVEFRGLDCQAPPTADDQAAYLALGNTEGDLAEVMASFKHGLATLTTDIYAVDVKMAPRLTTATWELDLSGLPAGGDLVWQAVGGLNPAALTVTRAGSPVTSTPLHTSDVDDHDCHRVEIVPGVYRFSAPHLAADPARGGDDSLELYLDFPVPAAGSAPVTLTRSYLGQTLTEVVDVNQVVLVNPGEGAAAAAERLEQVAADLAESRPAE